MAFLHLDGIEKVFSPGREASRALHPLTLSLAEGEFVAVLGPSGCGKSTLLQIIAGIESPSGGALALKGRDITRLAPEKRNFGMVFQNYALFPNLTVGQNIAYGLRGPDWNRRAARERCAELLALTGLQSLSGRYPAQLSGGQQQRAALARALAPRPVLLLLDEPLSALDAQVRLSLGQELRDIQRKTGVTAIMVTHDQQEALSLADRVILMNKGRIMQSGSPEEIYTAPACRFASEFIGHMNTLGASGIRYEDVRVLPASERALRREHTRIGRVTHSALMGAFYRLEVLLNDFSTRLYADVPRSSGKDITSENSIVAVYLPPACLHPLDREDS